MARRRYQRGSVKLVGKTTKQWLARWRESVITPDGVNRRIQKKEYIGTLKQIPTKREAQRVLEERLNQSGVNHRTYRPKVQVLFKDFAKDWETSVLTQRKPSYQASEKSRLRTHLVPAFGDRMVADITAYDVQQFIARASVGAKSKKNLIGTLSSMHNKAKAWKLTTEDWFEEVETPEWIKPPIRHYTAEEVVRMLKAAEEPDKTWLWCLAELGGRLGEACALHPQDFDFLRLRVTVRYSAWRSVHVGSTKAKKPRMFDISPQLAAHLQRYIKERELATDAYLFQRSDGTPWQGDHAVRDRLKPLLKRLGIPDGGAHAFRHFNVSLLMSANLPLSVIQDRVGHVDLETTLGYTHSQSSDHRKAADLMGRLLTQSVQ